MLITQLAWLGLFLIWVVGNYWFIPSCQSDSLQNIFNLTSQKPARTGPVLVNYNITWPALAHSWLGRRRGEAGNVICRLGGSNLPLWHLQSSRWALASHWASLVWPDLSQSCGWLAGWEDQRTGDNTPHLTWSDTWQPLWSQIYQPTIYLIEICPFCSQLVSFSKLTRSELIKD